jgi:hypothetical protein
MRFKALSQRSTIGTSPNADANAASFLSAPIARTTGRVRWIVATRSAPRSEVRPQPEADAVSASATAPLHTNRAFVAALAFRQHMSRSTAHRRTKTPYLPDGDAYGISSEDREGVRPPRFEGSQ